MSNMTSLPRDLPEDTNKNREIINEDEIKCEQKIKMKLGYTEKRPNSLNEMYTKKKIDVMKNVARLDETIEDSKRELYRLKEENQKLKAYTVSLREKIATLKSKLDLIMRQFPYE